MNSTARYLAVLALVLCAATMVAAAQETPEAYNVLITDRATGFLASCTEVRVYGVEPIENARLAVDPVAKLAYPANPILLQLAPGRYELAIWMFWLPNEVHYMYFDVADDAITAVDLMTVEFPTGLMTY